MDIDILLLTENVNKLYALEILCIKIQSVHVHVLMCNLIWFNLLFVHSVQQIKFIIKNKKNAKIVNKINFTTKLPESASVMNKKDIFGLAIHVLNVSSLNILIFKVNNARNVR